MADFYGDNEVFREIDALLKRWMERAFSEMGNLEQAVRNGQLNGRWNFKPITGPGVKGYVAYGQFQTGDRPPSIRYPLEDVKDAIRKPLTDIFDEEKNVKIYIEVPGVEKQDIQLDITEEALDVKAKKFHTTVKLPSGLDHEKASSKYTNGVLEVIIPKVQKSPDDEKRRTISVE